MRGLQTLGKWGLLLPLGMLTAGCSKHDTEHLARLSQKVAARAESWSESTTGSLHSGWQGFRANMDETGLDARVSTRLRWDKELADTPVQVEANGGDVTLKGKVSTLGQRQRAVALAESTAGVEKVVDQLEVPQE